MADDNFDFNAILAIASNDPSVAALGASPRPHDPPDDDPLPAKEPIDDPPPWEPPVKEEPPEE